MTREEADAQRRGDTLYADFEGCSTQAAEPRSLAVQPTRQHASGAGSGSSAPAPLGHRPTARAPSAGTPSAATPSSAWHRNSSRPLSAAGGPGASAAAPAARGRAASASAHGVDGTKPAAAAAAGRRRLSSVTASSHMRQEGKQRYENVEIGSFSPPSAAASAASNDTNAQRRTSSEPTGFDDIPPSRSGPTGSGADLRSPDEPTGFGGAIDDAGADGNGGSDGDSGDDAFGNVATKPPVGFSTATLTTARLTERDTEYATTAPMSTTLSTARRPEKIEYATPRRVAAELESFDVDNDLYGAIVEYEEEEDRQMCTECLKYSTKGVVSEVDGSWYCSECWVDTFDPFGAAAAATSDPLPATPGSGGGSSFGSPPQSGMDDLDVLSRSPQSPHNPFAGFGSPAEADARDEFGGFADGTITEIDLDSPEFKGFGEMAASESPNHGAGAQDGLVDSISILYIGCRGVTKSDGLATVQHAITEIEKQLEVEVLVGQRDGPIPGVFVALATSIKVEGAAAEKLGEIEPDAITFSFLAPGGKLSFITSDSRTKAMLCHLVQVQDLDEAGRLSQKLQDLTAGAVKREKLMAQGREEQLGAAMTRFARQPSHRLKPQVTKVFAHSQQRRGRAFSVKRLSKAARAQSSRVLAAPATVHEVDLAAPIGVVSCRHLGSVAVDQQQGDRVASSAIAQLAANDESWSSQDVAVVATLQGVKMVDVLTSEELMNVFIKEVTHCAQVTSMPALQPLAVRCGQAALQKCAYLVFIHTNVRLGAITAEVLQFTDPAAAKELQRCWKMGQDRQRKAHAKQVAATKQGGRSGALRGPFSPTSEWVEEVPDGLSHSLIDRESLGAIKVLGNGQFGQVWLAIQKVRAGTADERPPTHLAVKMVKHDASVAEGLEFLAECQTMALLKHPNVAGLAGVCIQQQPWLAAIEFLKYGDLKEVVKTCRKTRTVLRYAEQLYMCAQVALGLAHCASRRVIHMDIAARNCLLGSRNVVKVADFGLSRRLAPGRSFWRLDVVMKLPQRWQAVEAFKRQRFSEKSDVWGFGVTMWEIFTYGLLPFGHVPLQNVKRQVLDGQRLAKPAVCPDDLYALMHRCWLAEPESRPTFVQLYNHLLELQNANRRAAGRDYRGMRDLGRLLREGRGGRARPGVPLQAENTRIRWQLTPELADRVKGRTASTISSSEAMLDL